MPLRFNWDPNKSQINERKHGISFDEAAEAFHDPHFIMRFDRIEDGEIRWHTIGEVDEEVIRIISARRATPNERSRYEEENG